MRGNEQNLEAEKAFDEFLRRRGMGEEIDFDAFCGERASLSEALRVLHSNQVKGTNAAEPKETSGTPHLRATTQQTRAHHESPRTGLSVWDTDTRSPSRLPDSDERHRSLEEIVLAGEPEFTLIRRIQILQQAAMGVDHAHHRGVIHRHLEPQSIAVSDYGEVLVVGSNVANSRGHGSANARAPHEEGLEGRGAVETSQPEKGNLRYMAPEQAWGALESTDARTDVFGLGAILYFVLTGHPLYEGATHEELERSARQARVVPPRERSPERAIPEQLEEICLKAVAQRSNERYETARDFYAALQRYVEGLHDQERRAAEAQRLSVLADQRHCEWRRAEETARELREKERSLNGTLHGHESAEKKRPLWTLVEKLKTAQKDASRRFNETTAAYHSVLDAEPRNKGARWALAEMYYGRLKTAEERGDQGAALLYQGLVEQQREPTYQLLLRGEELLRLNTRPSKAEVFVSRYEEKEMRLVESEPEHLGTTPLETRLPRGSYVFLLRKKGYSDVHYPVLVGRDEHVDETIPLYPEGSIPEGFVQVPAGWSIVGGNPKQFPSIERRREWIEELLVSQFPVTVGEYCAFLNERFPDDERDAEELSRATPSYGNATFAARGPDGIFQPTRGLSARAPVGAVSLLAAHQYCAWLGERLDRPVRALTEIEWERCARGADGRVFPWGNEFDWSFCLGARSYQNLRKPGPVGEFRNDRSPFGICDLAGIVREICAPGPGSDEEIPVKGGSWYFDVPTQFRCDGRMVLQSNTQRSVDMGFRVCIPQPED